MPFFSLLSGIKSFVFSGIKSHGSDTELALQGAQMNEWKNDLGLNVLEGERRGGGKQRVPLSDMKR